MRGMLGWPTPPDIETPPVCRVSARHTGSGRLGGTVPLNCWCKPGLAFVTHRDQTAGRDLLRLEAHYIHASGRAG